MPTMISPVLHAGKARSYPRTTHVGWHVP